MIGTSRVLGASPAAIIRTWLRHWSARKSRTGTFDVSAQFGEALVAFFCCRVWFEAFACPILSFHRVFRRPGLSLNDGPPPSFRRDSQRGRVRLIIDT